ncbi:MAG: Rpn family recombination-promoting nuclease/putative transposase [Roseburia sp.]|nr:Rpn family recombination-promoting nuclease/putative transposase [Roseburia sp.]MCM1241853.1 Rpn family recombination-promoting nuclease/putative transposase [Roseburia sp.]
MKQNKSVISQSPIDPVTSLQNAHGPIPYGMTNDYMFRAVLQTNNKVLRGLVRSLLHLKENEVVSVKITNPIILGDSIEKKEFRLDINVILNDNTFINLEMQVVNQLNWNNRSLLYLCRSFDNLHRGQNYNNMPTVIHIGFLDYTLFEKYPEFYSTYKLMNVKNYKIYNDNFTLCVIDLSQIELATKEDKKHSIDYWAKLFRATTWEELIMLAAKNEYLQEASKTMFELSADEQIRKQCLDREEYYQDLRNYEKAIIERDAAIAEKDALLRKTIAQRDDLLQKASVETERLRALLKKHGIDDSE